MLGWIVLIRRGGPKGVVFHPFSSISFPQPHLGEHHFLASPCRTRCTLKCTLPAAFTELRTILSQAELPSGPCGSSPTSCALYTSHQPLVLSGVLSCMLPLLLMCVTAEQGDRAGNGGRFSQPPLAVRFLQGQGMLWYRVGLCGFVLKGNIHICYSL